MSSSTGGARTPVKKQSLLGSMLGRNSTSARKSSKSGWSPTPGQRIELSDSPFDSSITKKAPPPKGLARLSLEGIIAPGKVAEEKGKLREALGTWNGENTTPANNANVTPSKNNGGSSVEVDSSGAYFFGAVAPFSLSGSAKKRQGARESLEGLRGTGRVARLRDEHVAAFKEKARPGREVQGSDVKGLVSLFEGALARHEASKRLALSNQARPSRPKLLPKKQQGQHQHGGGLLDPKLSLLQEPLSDADLILEALQRDKEAAPSFANVSAEAKSLVVLITAADLMTHIEYYHKRQGSDLEGRWIRVQDNAIRLEIHQAGTHVFASRSVDRETGEVLTLPSTAVFENSSGLPEIVKSATHSTELCRTLCAEAPLSCFLCAISLDGAPAFVCKHSAATHVDAHIIECGDACSYALCTECALPKKKAKRQASDRSQTSDRRSSVALDVGAKRLWLSEDVQFHGNATAILEESTELVEQIASLLLDHPSIENVQLQGHTNSKCGLHCDGSKACTNDTCSTNFGATGGAVAFSLARAAAVKQSLVQMGVQPWRIQAVGLAGSRRLYDTEGPDNALNRRVEIHLDDNENPKLEEEQEQEQDYSPTLEEEQEQEQDYSPTLEDQYELVQEEEEEEQDQEQKEEDGNFFDDLLAGHAEEASLPHVEPEKKWHSNFIDLDEL